MTPKITVFIPCYNYAHYLTEAVGSVLRQSFEDWEAIVIDDASPDNTAEVMRTFTDPRIVLVFHKENKGNIATYNEAIEMAQGELVVGLSADDRYRRDFLKRTVATFDAHPEIGMVYTGWKLIDKQGRPFKTIHSSPHKVDGVYDEFPYLLFGCHIPQCATTVRREILKRVGLFDPELTQIGDWDLWLRISRHYKVGFISEVLYEYRRHGTNMSVQPETSIQRKQQAELVLSRLLSDPDLAPSVRAKEKQIWAWYQWGVAEGRFTRQEFSGGLRAMSVALSQYPSIALRPKRWASLLRSFVRGAVKNPTWGEFVGLPSIVRITR